MALLLLGLGLATGTECLADGKLFPRVGIPHTETPAQRALLVWADGVESLAIETTAKTEATNLAWILPLPARPTSIEPLDSGVFSTLETTFQPRVRLEGGRDWMLAMALAAVLFAIRWRILGLVRFGARDVVLTLLLLGIVSLFLLPALAKAKGGGNTSRPATIPSTVQLLSESRAGVYDITTLTARRAEDLVAWLRDHNYQAPAELLPPVRDYLAQGWVFVAAKVDVPATNTLTALHPLLFRFASPSPVYPMRLTGIDGHPLRCDLYVFGPGRASAPGWDTTFCGRTDASDPDRPQLIPGPFRVRQPVLRSLVSGSAVATRLSGTLEAGDFTRDVRIQWGRYRPTGQEIYTRRAARLLAASIAGWSLALVALIGSMPGLARRPPRHVRWFTRMDQVGALISIGMGLGWYALAPTLGDGEYRVTRGGASLGRQQVLEVALEAEDHQATPGVAETAPIPGGTAATALPRLREHLARFLRTHAYPPDQTWRQRWLTNVFTGERLRLEASPGNLTLETTNGSRTVVYWHDFDGAPSYPTEVPVVDPPDGKAP